MFYGKAIEERRAGGRVLGTIRRLGFGAKALDGAPVYGVAEAPPFRNAIARTRLWEGVRVGYFETGYGESFIEWREGMS
jgi:hypothetical protein